MIARGTAAVTRNHVRPARIAGVGAQAKEAQPAEPEGGEAGHDEDQGAHPGNAHELGAEGRVRRDDGADQPGDEQGRRHEAQQVGAGVHVVERVPVRPAADDGRPEQERAGMRHERGQVGAGREVRQDGRVGQPADHDDGGQRGEGEPAWPAARPASDPDPEQGGQGELDRAKGRRRGAPGRPRSRRRRPAASRPPWRPPGRPAPPPPGQAVVTNASARCQSGSRWPTTAGMRARRRVATAAAAEGPTATCSTTKPLRTR